MEVTLPASKTDSFRKGIKLIIASTGNEGCPVRAMKGLIEIDTHRPLLASLFCIGKYDQRPFSREYVVQKLQTLAIFAGLGTGSWNGHSFRRGAATWAAEVGVPEREIQTLGRWRSEAYKAYIEYSRDEQISLSKRFQKMLKPATALQAIRRHLPWYGRGCSPPDGRSQAHRERLPASDWDTSVANDLWWQGQRQPNQNTCRRGTTPS